jgi:hypothetical protein
VRRVTEWDVGGVRDADDQQLATRIGGGDVRADGESVGALPAREQVLVEPTDLGCRAVPRRPTGGRRDRIDSSRHELPRKLQVAVEDLVRPLQSSGQERGPREATDLSDRRAQVFLVGGGPCPRDDQAADLGRAAAVADGDGVELSAAGEGVRHLRPDDVLEARLLRGVQVEDLLLRDRVPHDDATRLGPEGRVLGAHGADAHVPSVVGEHEVDARGHVCAVRLVRARGRVQRGHAVHDLGTRSACVSVRGSEACARLLELPHAVGALALELDHEVLREAAHATETGL